MVKSGPVECGNARSLFLFVFRCLSLFFSDGTIQFCELISAGHSQYWPAFGLDFAALVQLEATCRFDVTLHLNWWSNRCRLPMRHSPRLGECRCKWLRRLQQAKRTRKKNTAKSFGWSGENLTYLMNNQHDASVKKHNLCRLFPHAFSCILLQHRRRSVHVSILTLLSIFWSWRYSKLSIGVVLMSFFDLQIVIKLNWQSL